MRAADAGALGLAAAMIAAAWVEPLWAPAQASVETRLDLIVGLALPMVLALMVLTNLARRWLASRGSGPRPPAPARPGLGRGGPPKAQPG